MFLKDSKEYQRFLEDTAHLKGASLQNQKQLLKQANLGAEFRENFLLESMLRYARDFVYWIDCEAMGELMPQGKQIGFDLDTLDEFEEAFYHIYHLQMTDGNGEEAEKHFAIKIASAFIAALLHYQHGLDYAFPKTLNEGSSWAVGIKFPSGREFSLYAYLRRLLNLLDAINDDEDFGKFNGTTQDFLRALLRSEANWDFNQFPLFQEWRRHVNPSEYRQMETYLKNAEALAAVSLIAQEENADSTPMVFAYYCRDLLLDLFDGSLAEHGQQLGLDLPVLKFRFYDWQGLDELMFIKFKKLIADGMPTDDQKALFQAGDLVRMRLSGLLYAILNISSPTETTFIIPVDRFSIWISPLGAQEAQEINLQEGSFLKDTDVFSMPVLRALLHACKPTTVQPEPAKAISSSLEHAKRRLISINQRFSTGDAIDAMSLGKAILSHYQTSKLFVERPEKIFATRRNPCYHIIGELRSLNQSGQKLFESAILHCLDWVRGRQFFPESQLENSSEHFDSENHKELGFPSFNFEGAFTVQVYSFPAKGKWMMRLYEPDNGVYLNDDEFIPGEPGRFVENHIALWLAGNKLMASFTTFVTHSHQNKSVYRGSCASLISLMREQGLHLRSGGVFDAMPLICQTQKETRNAAALARESLGQIPTVVCVYQDALDYVKKILKETDKQVQGMRIHHRRVENVLEWESFKQHALAQEDEAWALHNQQLHAFMTLVGYCAFKARVILLPEGMTSYFEKLSGLTAKANALALFCSTDTAPQIVLPMAEFLNAPKETAMGILEAIFRHYGDNGILDSGFTYHQAMALEIAEDEGKITANEEWQAFHDHSLKMLDEQHTSALEQAQRTFDKALAAYNSELTAQQKQHQSLMDKLAEAQSKQADQSANSGAISALDAQLKEKTLRVNYLESLQSRPRSFDSIESWLDTHFADTIELTSRAMRELKDIAPNAFNLPLLCDCLEFLGDEYHAELQGYITPQELNRRCQIKYGRVFTVTPNKSGVKGEYSEQYQVAWKGEKRELDLHLKVGNTAPHLIRIYFFYDSNEKEIIIGSLPGHLDV